MPKKNLPFRFAPVDVVIFFPVKKGIPLFFPKIVPKEGGLVLCVYCMILTI